MLGPEEMALWVSCKKRTCVQNLCTMLKLGILVYNSGEGRDAETGESPELAGEEL